MERLLADVQNPQSPVFKWAVGGVAGIVFLLAAGFSFIFLLSAVLSLLIGIQLALWIVKESDGAAFGPLFDWLTERYFGDSEKRENRGRKTEIMQSTQVKPGGRNMPWEGLFLPSALNETLELLLEQIVDEYVNNWYEMGISRDRDFLNEIRYQLRYACACLFRRLRELDLAEIVAQEALPAAALHFDQILRIEDQIMDIKNLPKSLVETRICERYTKFHYAMASRQAELNYLRQIADFLIPHVLDETRLAGRAHDDDSPAKYAQQRKAQRPWPCHSPRHFLREMLANAVLQPSLDLAADPDYINQLLILLVDTLNASPDPGNEVEWKETSPVAFLKGLSEQLTDAVPDSLLQLKLSEILRDARQYSMFQLYLRDVRGPINELTFLAEATRIHESMQKKIIELANKNAPEGSGEIVIDDGVRSETPSQITYDVWQLFGQFVHESAPDRIRLPDDVFNQFKEAVESNDTLVLDNILEKSFQLIYAQMQTDYVIPFCQSECFLGYLCGSPPISVNELIEMPSVVSRKTTIAEKGFSLAQLRWRIQKALTLSSTDSLVDEEEEEATTGGQTPDTLNPANLGIKGDEEDTNQAVLIVRPAVVQQNLTTTAAEHLDRAISEGRSMEKEKDTSSLSLTTSGSGMVESRSMPLFTVPSIDVSLSEELVSAVDKTYSPRSENYSDEDLHLPSSSNVASVDESPQTVLIDDDSKNINHWRVEVTSLVPYRDYAGKLNYTYSIDVDRTDAQSHETKRWSIYRNFNEFYVLETKLLEFHRETLRFVPLPQRKSFVTKDRTYLEQHRLIFSAFLASLCKQRVLKRSDLMSAFLTVPDEFRDTLQLSDLNPWKVVKRMPSKLSREKGQNLKPFLLNILASTLAPPPAQVEKHKGDEEKLPQAQQPSAEIVQGSANNSSIDSVSEAEVGKETQSRKAALYSNIYGNNVAGITGVNKTEILELVKQEEQDSSVRENNLKWTRNFCDSLILLAADLNLPTWLMSALALIRKLFSSALDRLALLNLRKLETLVLHEENMVVLVQSIQRALFFSDASAYPTEQEKQLRAELVKTKLVDWGQEQLPSEVLRALDLQKVRDSVRRLITVLQYPRLNKQLLFVLIDTLTRRLFEKELSTV